MFKSFLYRLVLITIIVFIVAAVAGFLYELTVHGRGEFDWLNSLRLAIIFGITLPLIDAWDRWRKTK